MTDQADQTHETAPDLTWTIRAYKRDPNKLIGVFFASLVAGVAGYILIGVLGVIVGFFGIAAATADFWLPVQFVLNETSANRRCGMSITSIVWSEVKRAEIGENGVKLSPLEQADTRMEPFRGVFLQFDGNRDQVISTVEKFWGQDVRPLG